MPRCCLIASMMCWLGSKRTCSCFFVYVSILFLAYNQNIDASSQFTNENKKSQKYLIGSLEKLVDKYPSLLAKVRRAEQPCHYVLIFRQFAVLLKGLYDVDVLEEEAILDWSSKVGLMCYHHSICLESQISKKYVSKELATKIHENDKVVALVKWLKYTCFLLR